MISNIPLVLGDHRILHPGKWRWARSLAWMVALIFAIMLAFGPAMETLSHVVPDQPVYRFLVKATGALIVLGSYALFVRLGERRWPEELALAAAPAGVLVGLAVGLILFSIVMAVLIGAGLYDFSYHGPASAWRGAGLGYCHVKFSGWEFGFDWVISCGGGRRGIPLRH